MSYLAVTNFRKFQHYKNRKPPWIKFYVDLLDPKNKINSLPIPTRYLFDRLLLLAAEWDNAIPNDYELIAKLVAMDKRACREGLAQLTEGRWLSQRQTKRRASKSASKPASDLAPPELEEEEEKETENPATETVLEDVAREAHDGNGHGGGFEEDLEKINRLLLEAAAQDMPA